MLQEDRNLDYNQNILESFKIFKYDDEEINMSENGLDQSMIAAKNIKITEIKDKDQ